MKKNWNWMIMRGFFGIIFGILCFLWPIAALITASALFAVYAFVGGAISLNVALEQYRTHHRWGLLALQGSVGIMAGIGALFYPGIALFSLIVLIAIWALISGFLEIGVAFSAREFVGHPAWFGIAGIISVLFGVSLLIWPLNGLSFLVAFIGVYALINGIFFIVWGVRHQIPTDSQSPLKTVFGA